MRVSIIFRLVVVVASRLLMGLFVVGALCSCGSSKSDSGTPSEAHKVTVTANVRVTSADHSLHDNSVLGQSNTDIPVLLSLLDFDHPATQWETTQQIKIGASKSFVFSVDYTHDSYQFKIPDFKNSNESCVLRTPPKFTLDSQHGYSTDLQYVCSAKQPGPPTPTPGAADKVAVGYYTNYGDTVPGVTKPADVQTLVDSLASTVSHGYNVIDLAFINFYPIVVAGNKVLDSEINPVVKCDASGQKPLGDCVAAIKLQYPKARILASIGGQGTPATTFEFLTDADSIDANVASLLQYLKAQHLDGVDFDLEPAPKSLLFAHTAAYNFLQFIQKLHTAEPDLILTFAAQSPDLWQPPVAGTNDVGGFLFLDIWNYLIKSGSWHGWFQIQFYNQNSSKPDNASCAYNQPFDAYFSGSCGWGGSNIFTKYAASSDPGVMNPPYPNFDRHFVIGTPASAFAANNYINMTYVPGDENNIVKNLCDNLKQGVGSPSTPAQIISDYMDNAFEHGHSNIRGFMTWDTYNDFYAQNYSCKQFGADYSKGNTVSWPAYDWISTLKTRFLQQ